MDDRPATPDEYHDRRHVRPQLRGRSRFPHGIGTGPVDCWYCQRAVAHCRDKRRFVTLGEAQDVVDELNHRRAYKPPVGRYWCLWCGHWHLKSARRKEERRIAEQARRKWLIAQHAAEDKGKRVPPLPDMPSPAIPSPPISDEPRTQKSPGPSEEGRGFLFASTSRPVACQSAGRRVPCPSPRLPPGPAS